MNHSRSILVGLLALALSPLPVFAAAAAKGKSDILPPARRQPSVDRAAKIAEAPVVLPLPEELPTPFNPPDFDRLEPDERPAPPQPVVKQAPSAGNADREILESLAERIKPTGTLTGRDGKPMLTFPDARRLSVGQGFVVTDKDMNYELEIVAIDRTTFTLRYRKEEIVRPIRTK
jgi:hypothetical protein